MAVPNEFYICFHKYNHYSDLAIDWFIKSFRYKHKSDEWKICRLKIKIFMKKAIKYLKEANKCIK